MEESLIVRLTRAKLNNTYSEVATKVTIGELAEELNAVHKTNNCITLVVPTNPEETEGVHLIATNDLNLARILQGIAERFMHEDRDLEVLPIDTDT